MNALEYSDGAMNVLNMFHERDVMVYVEGVDDIHFWEVVFSRASRFSVKIEPAGGICELEKIIKKIEHGKITAIAACDLDHRFPNRLANPSSNVIYTYGHSIENTIICEHTIKSVISAHAKTSRANVSSVALHLWRREFYSAIKELVLFDIANFIYKKGFSILGDNCSKFLVDGSSDRLSESKLASHVEKLRPSFKDVDFIDIENRIRDSAREVIDYIRGHFLFSMFLKYSYNKIKTIKSNASLSVDAFYGSLLIAFDTVFNARHSHFSYYAESIARIKL